MMVIPPIYLPETGWDGAIAGYGLHFGIIQRRPVSAVPTAQILATKPYTAAGLLILDQGLDLVRKVAPNAAHGMRIVTRQIADVYNLFLNWVSRGLGRGGCLGLYCVFGRGRRLGIRHCAGHSRPRIHRFHGHFHGLRRHIGSISARGRRGGRINGYNTGFAGSWDRSNGSDHSRNSALGGRITGGNLTIGDV